MNNITKHILAFLFFSFLFGEGLGGISSFAQSSNTFMRTFRAAGMNGGLSLAETSDGGFIGTGQHASTGAGNCDIYVYKVDGCGNPEWFKTYGGPSEDGGKSVQQTSDGGYIVAGLAFLGAGNYDMTLIKLDPLGNIQWSKVFGGGGADYGLYVQQTSDGGYIMTGYLTGLGFGAEDLALIKTDSNGNLQWMKVYGGAGSEWGNYVEQTSDGGYKVAGYTTSFGAGGFDIYVIKVDGAGNLQWSKTYGGGASEGSSQWGITGQTTTDGGFMVCANTNSYGAGSNDVLLIKTDSIGNLEWSKTYGGAGDDQPRSAEQTFDGGFIISGYTTSFGHGDLDAYLIKTTSNGTLQWSKAYGGTAYDKGSMVRQAADGGYALSIVTASFGADYYDPLFMKTDSMGVVGCNELNCATIVSSVTPSVGSGGAEMVPAATVAVPTISTNNYTPTDIFLCQHCITIPSFVPSDTIACVGETVFFYNTTSVGKTCNENWYINGTVVNGDKDTLPFIFNTAGIHIIQLIASCGNSTDTNTINIHVYDVPVAAYTNTNVCKGIATQFTNGSTIASGSITSTTWNFDDGSALNNSQSPSHTYVNESIYNVTLTVSNSFGCADTLTKTVPVYFNPVSGFTHSDVCFKDSMYFANTSTVDNSTSIAGYLWAFGDGGATSNLTSPAHYYSTAGTDTVALIATTTDGCSDTSYTAVNTFDPPTSVFTFNAICLYDSVHLVNASLSPTMGSTASWSWSFGDGSPLNTSVWNPSHIFSNPGTYLIILTTVSSNLGCMDTLQAPIIVPPTPIADFSSSDVCANQAINFNDISTVSSGSIIGRVWDFGDGSPVDTTANPSHTYATQGTYSVTLIVITDRGCKDTISKSAVGHPIPTVYFNALDVCDMNPVFLNNFSSIPLSDTIQSYTWNLGDGSPINYNPSFSHLYDSSGSYSVKLIVVSTFGCSDSITKTVIVHPNPVSNYSSTSVCNNSLTQFTDSSTTLLGTMDTWSWNFADGSSLNSNTNPSHLYANAGIYNTTLIVKNSFGCKDTITKPVKVFYNPVAGFTFNNVCFGDSMYFTNTSTVDNSTSITKYLWAFGDGSATSSLQNPSHYYSIAGTYSVTLVASTIDSCPNAITLTVNAFDAPASAFTFNNTCLFDSAKYTNTSIAPTMGSTSNWSWDFGDGSPLNTTVWNPGHLYATTGSYQVTLITHSSNLGCPDTLKDSITVFPMPLADFSFTNVCLNQSLNFNDLSTVPSGTIANRIWNFGDGTSPNSNTNPSHIYSSSGTFIVSLIVTTDNGCKDTMIKSVVVHPLPNVQFSAPAVCDGSMVQFTDLSTIPTTDTLESWTWNFGDGSPVINNQNTSYLFASAGSHTVQLLVVSNFGCIDSVSKTCIVNPNPVVLFAANYDTVGCEPLCISFQNLSTIATGSNMAWVWNYGDGSPTTFVQNPNHCYTNDSEFLPNLLDVTLTITSDLGCVSILTKNNYVTVYPNPNADFNVQPQTTTIVDPVISITNLSTGTNYWNWNFGDTDTSSSINPAPHTYADTGIYTITLITSTQYGCVDTAYETVIIEPDFLFYIPSAFTPNDDGINDTFLGKGIYIRSYEMSIFDRWGTLIFFSDSINKPWDGKANHGTETAKGDVYVYSFKITDIQQKKHSYKGIVTLVK